jgi:hypothetical protein
MDSYPLEFRLSGSARKYVKQLALRVAKEFHVRGLTTHRVVPHVSVVGSFNTAFEKRVISDMENICKKYDLMNFKFEGFRQFGNFVWKKSIGDKYQSLIRVSGIKVRSGKSSCGVL